MLCRRCNSKRLIRLKVINPMDNPVYRCGECSFLFSPGGSPAAPEEAGPSATPGVAHRQFRPTSRGG